MIQFAPEVLIKSFLFERSVGCVRLRPASHGSAAHRVSTCKEVCHARGSDQARSPPPPARARLVVCGGGRERMDGLGWHVRSQPQSLGRPRTGILEGGRLRTPPDSRPAHSGDSEHTRHRGYTVSTHDTVDTRHRQLRHHLGRPLERSPPTRASGAAGRRKRLLGRLARRCTGRRRRHARRRRRSPRS